MQRSNLRNASWHRPSPERAGLDPFLNVLVAQVSLLVYRETYVTFQTQQMVASVQLIEALGGGWDASRLPTAEEVRAKASPRLP